MKTRRKYFFTRKLGAETVHELVSGFLRVIQHIPGALRLVNHMYGYRHPSLEREVFGLKFRNPIGMAAGFDRNGEIIPALNALGFGFVEIGTVTPVPQTGNPKPRLMALTKDEAIVNRVGLASKGLDRVVTNIRRNHGDMIIGCNIGKNSITSPDDAWQDYLKVFRTMYQYVDYFSVNVSNNTTFTQYVPNDRESIMRIIEPLFEFRRGQNQYRPILLKISPDLDDASIDLMTDIMVETPLDGIVATNATVDTSAIIDSEQEWKQLGGGAVSGRPLTKRSLEVVKRIYDRSHGTYPIIGVGGLMNADDVKAMLKAGASLVQVLTGYVYYGPKFTGDVCRSMTYLEEQYNKPLK